jgi:hypothetical protein
MTELATDMPINLIATKALHSTMQILPSYLKLFCSETDTGNQLIKSNAFIEKNTKIDSIFGYLSDKNQTSNQLEVCVSKKQNELSSPTLFYYLFQFEDN